MCKYSSQQLKTHIGTVHLKGLIKNVKHRPVMRQLKKCENCGGFITKDLTRHMQTHSNEKPFKCNTCNYAARQKEIQKHIMLTHNGTKSRTCYLCDYASNYECNVKKHMEIKHTTQKLARRDIKCKRVPGMHTLKLFICESNKNAITVNVISLRRKH